MKIAVCDDEIILYEELYTLLNEYSTLKKEPILTTYFKTGYDLLSSTEKFDIIFMDYQMDDIDGLETSKRLRLKNSRKKMQTYLSRKCYQPITDFYYYINNSNLVDIYVGINGNIV